MKSLIWAVAVCWAAAMIPGPLFAEEVPSDGLRVGWASVDITPDEPVVLRGQFHARVSEGVMDPVTATALGWNIRGNRALRRGEVIFLKPKPA